ncbi:MAG: hypothetical protein RIE84_07690 [Parvibaculum sp.]|uniref:hypothetical protein n=1 Tax=Parvibaculum sp. TaxID=2024848 RepID=UPI0032EF5F55
MDDDQKELLGRLFGVACDVLERAHETAAAGQARDVDAKQAALCARDLGKAADRLGALAETMRLVAEDRPRREKA